MSPPINDELTYQDQREVGSLLDINSARSCKIRRPRARSTCSGSHCELRGVQNHKNKQYLQFHHLRQSFSEITEETNAENVVEIVEESKSMF